MRKLASRKISSAEFDRQFEDGDVTEHLDMAKAKVLRKVQRVNIDFPKTMLSRLDAEARRNGVPRR